MNKLVAALDPPYCHVEIEFDVKLVPRNGIFHGVTHETMASSIYADEHVFLRKKTFANPLYDIITINVSTANFRNMYSFCEQEARNQVTFSSTGMYCAYIPCASCVGNCVRSKHATFCSEFVCNVLKIGRISAVQDVKSSTMTPSRLKNLLSIETSNMFSTVPYKMQLLDI
jgi:hypothetical protein